LAGAGLGKRNWAAREKGTAAAGAALGKGKWLARGIGQGGIGEGELASARMWLARGCG